MTTLHMIQLIASGIAFCAAAGVFFIARENAIRLEGKR